MSGDLDTRPGRIVAVILFLGGTVVGLGSMLISCVSCQQDPSGIPGAINWTGGPALGVAIFAFIVAGFGLYMVHAYDND